MDLNTLIIPFFLLTLISNFPFMVKSSKCSVSKCGDPSSSPRIRYPFRVKNSDHPPNSCGKPGFNVRCNEKSYYSTLIELPNSVPVQWPPSLHDDTVLSLSSDIHDDIRLSWYMPECRLCELKGQMCGLETDSSGSDVIVCSSDFDEGDSGDAMFAIGLLYAAPLILISLFCIMYFLMKARRNIPLNTTLSSIPMTSSVVVHGLNRSVIDSYPKIVLGETKRLPKPEHKSCSICLGEYESNEILRAIPICGHYFHAHCIDEWLLLNASCPICRISLFRVPRNIVSSA
ncbi:unnamed protein product [Amaranthus hypochondriacus]